MSVPWTSAPPILKPQFTKTDVILGQIKRSLCLRYYFLPPLTSGVSKDHGPKLQGRCGRCLAAGGSVPGTVGQSAGRGSGPAAWCGAGLHHVLSNGIWNPGLSFVQ